MAAPSRNEKIRSFARDFSSSRRAPPKAASKPYLSSACLSASVFITSVCTCWPWSKGLIPWADAVLVDVHDQLRARAPSPSASRNAYMSRNFHVVSTCISGNGGVRRRERLLGQAQHHRAVLADRVEHHRVLELGDHLAHDVDALGLELLEMCELHARDAQRSTSASTGMRLSSSSRASTTAAASGGVRPAVSSRTSGSSGSSYGAETPVNSSISPANACA